MGNELAQPDPVGVFERDRWHFTVVAEGGRYRVEAREGAADAQVICRMSPACGPEWYTVWSIDAWRPWVEMEAQKIIAKVDAI